MHQIFTSLFRTASAATALIYTDCTSALDVLPLAPMKPSPTGAALFTALQPEDTGISHVNHMDVDHPMSYLYHSGMTCGGVAIGDFDGDGNQDIFFAGSTAPNRLYRQKGNLKFEDITASAGTGLDGGDAWSAGVTAADVNGDGRLDLYVSNYMVPNHLFLNMGKGPKGEPVVFKECAGEAGLDVVSCSHSAAFADYDGDGMLDVYVLTNRIEDPDGAPAEMPIVKGTIGENKLPDVLPEKKSMYRVWRWDKDNWGTEPIGDVDRLFRQTGVNTDGVPLFEDSSKAAGISGYGDGLSVLWWDPDSDGDPDIYVGNDFVAGDCWYENNGDGTFTNVLKDRVPHTPWFSMGSDFADVNGDGRLDLLVADMSATSHFKSKTTMGIMGGIPLDRSFYDSPPQLMRNALYLSTGTHRYAEGAASFKVSSTDWTWSVKFADYDLDGWQDVYFTNGISRHMNDSDIKVTEGMLVGKHMFDFWKQGEMRKELNRSYQNFHGEKFIETTEDWGLGHLGVSYGSAIGDLDNDGDPDLVTVNLEEPDTIYLNNASNPNRIAVELTGAGKNTKALNATVHIKTTHGSQFRHLTSISGYLSCNQNLAIFGLGDDDRVEELSVHWPHGGVQTLKNLAAGKKYSIRQDENANTPSAEKKIDPLFVEHQQLSLMKHQDTGWEADFKKEDQSLLPWAFSQLGPCLASSDVDGDGDTDFFMGGSAGQLGQLRINEGGGKFKAQWVDAFAQDKAAEDAGAVFFDADGDGDVDLFVASGSNDFTSESAALQDRLYLNDGKGTFTAAPAEALPMDRLIGSAVCAADFDRDGDVDLFVGTRLKPGAYPLSEKSRILLNDSRSGTAKFVTASIELLDSLGMVTAAVAADVDRDGWVDLLTASEWGSIRWIRNVDGKFTDQSAEAGLAAVTGFWNSLTIVDVDSDGDFDLIAGNLGLNTKYKQPSPEKPHIAYYGDFDGTGAHLVEVKREGDQLYPERGRSCSSRAMPFIAEKFGTFKSFAVASLEEIYTEEKLTSANQLSVVEFQSGVFINDGGGKFRFQPLPNAAQLAPVYGTTSGDFTGDGKTDLLLSGNFIWGPQIEAGPFDGGVGLLLKGNGNGNFEPVDSKESGVLLPGDHRALIHIDLDGDHRPDIICAANNGALRALRNNTPESARWLEVRLPQESAIGAIVSFNGQSQSLSAGDGYWSQNDSTAWFGLGSTAVAGEITVNWPDGSKTTHPWDGQSPQLTITKQ
jgi:hypothetical protein